MTGAAVEPGANSWRIGIDVGGTFTDVIALNPAAGEVRAAKVRSRKDGSVEGLKSALKAVGLSWPQAADLVYGTTVVTNAIVEDRLDDVALVITAGFADVLAIGRQNRRYLYRLDVPPKAEPQVTGDRLVEVTERMDVDGRVLVELTDQAMDDVVARVADTGVTAVAVCLLHSYANADHEERLGRRLAGIVPHVALSHRVNPEAREYERAATTVLSASMMPLAAAHLERLERERPPASRLHLFHSAGGMSSPRQLRKFPLGLALSGPAAGIAAASQVARQAAIGRAISFDMGGTTTDVCLITDGRAAIESDRVLAGRPLRQPMVAVESIGAGGGSIARMDTGVLRVGPESAGAEPGPACYGKGGTQPTVSDANLVLGYLNADKPLGGTGDDGFRLDLRAAEKVLTPLAHELGGSLVDAARGVIRIANAAMVRALNRVTVKKGVDGRQCTLLAFGGAGPMHAVELARAFGISRVLVPRFSGGFSALGCAAAEMTYSRQQTLRMASTDFDRQRLSRTRLRMRNELMKPLVEADGEKSPIAVDEVAAVRYSGQSYAVEITAPDLDDCQNLGRQFRDEHQRLYGFATDEPWELVRLRISVRVPREQNLPPPGLVGNRAGNRSGWRPGGRHCFLLVR